MTYSESAKGQTISKERAFQEIEEHITLDEETKQDFYNICGDKEHYDAYEVLCFLGY